MARIISVEDETDLSQLLRYNLEKEGHLVETVASGEQFFRNIGSFKPDLALLDLMLPGMSGLDILRQIKASADWKDLPVIILSAKGSEADKVIGLELGADDYLSKPFSVKELVSRVKAVLRRTERVEERKPVFEYKSLRIDFDSVRVEVDGKEVHLSPYEFKILAFLVTHPDRAYSRDDLLDMVWKDGAFVQPRTVDVHIRRLRTLIEKDAANPVYIQTVRGFGYIFKPEK